MRIEMLHGQADGAIINEDDEPPLHVFCPVETPSGKTRWFAEYTLMKEEGIYVFSGYRKHDGPTYRTR